MAGRTISKDVVRIVSAENTGDFHVVFTGLSILGVYVLFLLLFAAEKMGQGDCIWRNSTFVVDCNFRPNLSGKICVDFVVCSAGDCGGNKYMIN